MWILFLVGLLALFLIFSLVACSSESSTTSKAKDKNEEKSSEAKAKVEAEAAVVAASSEGSEFFDNCTELRKKYPDGVASDHPAYQSKMDRDHDNFACER